MIKKLLGTILINIFSFYLASQIVPTFIFNQDLKNTVLLIAIFTIVHLLIKPLINIVLTPLNFLSLGLVSFIVDILIFYVLTNFVGNVSLSPWTMPRLDFLDMTISARDFGKLETLVIVASIVSLTRSFLTGIFSE